LWARVRDNTGVALAAGHDVWFKVHRPDGTAFWAGATSVSDLAAVVTMLQPWTASAAIAKNSAWNLLRVVAHGAVLRFYINGTQVWAGIDTSLTSGEVGWGFYSDVAAGNNLWVDYAVLSDPGGA
jgi:hypothetical protein